MIFSRWVSLTLTALLAFDVISLVVSEGDRDLQSGKGKGKGGGGCPGPLVEFESEVLVDFDGFDEDASDITRINWDALELAFRNSYNSLSEDLCDDQFRRVIDVKIQVNSNGEILIKRGGALYSLRYLVTAVCRGCNPDTITLFSPPEGESFRKLIASDGLSADQSNTDSVTQRRRAKSSKKESNKDSKSTKKDSKSGGGVEESCECDSANPEYRAPTEEEFRIAYDAEIRIFQQSRSFRRGGVAVDLVVKVTEVEDASCSVVVEEFMTLVSVEFFGDRDAVTDEERASLEENFVQVYNGLQANRCDSPFFRTAVLAEIVLVSDPDEPQVFLYIFAVTATCRGEGCSADLTLFQMDEFLRKLASDIWFDPDSECQCPIFGNNFGPPTTSDFEVRYFQVVQDLRDNGDLTNIDASGEVLELPSDFTAFPTDQPTPEISPSAPSAIIAPSNSPSPSATATPTSPDVTLTPSRPGDTFAPSGFPVGELPIITFPPTTPGDSLAPSYFPSSSPNAEGTEAPSVSVEPTIGNTEAPSTSSEPSPPSDILSPTLTVPPTVSEEPSIANVTGLPTVSAAPSVSGAPSTPGDTEVPTVSNAPTVSNETGVPTVSSAPSVSALPTLPDATEPPSVSNEPTLSQEPSPLDGTISPTVSPAPSVSQAPSQPDESDPPSVSNAPSVTNRPTEGGDTVAPLLTDPPSVSNSPSATASPSLSSEPSLSSSPSVPQQVTT
jgi:hypothetical protein